MIANYYSLTPIARLVNICGDNTYDVVVTIHQQKQSSGFEGCKK